MSLLSVVVLLIAWWAGGLGLTSLVCVAEGFPAHPFDHLSVRSATSSVPAPPMCRVARNPSDGGGDYVVNDERLVSCPHSKRLASISLDWFAIPRSTCANSVGGVRRSGMNEPFVPPRGH